MWPCVPDGEVNDALHCGKVELAPVALIRRGGIVEAIADDDLTTSERRTDEFAHQLRAAGVHQQQLGFPRHRVIIFAVLQRVADFLADGRAAGLARDAHRVAKLAQPLGEQRHLRGFATAFRALERDEQTFPAR